MTNQDLIKAALEQYFSKYNQYHIIILIVFAAFQVLMAFYLNQKLELFKGHLKKTEIKFSKYHELQVEALREGYKKLVNFSSANKALFYSGYDSNDHHHFKKRISQWILTYNEYISQFANDKILLSKDLKGLISKTMADFREVIVILVREKADLEYTEMEGQGNWNQMYDYSDRELEIINQKIEKMKKSEFITNTNTNIRLLRKNIEDHFASMNE